MQIHVNRIKRLVKKGATVTKVLFDPHGEVIRVALSGNPEIFNNPQTTKGIKVVEQIIGNALHEKMLLTSTGANYYFSPPGKLGKVKEFKQLLAQHKIPIQQNRAGFNKGDAIKVTKKYQK